MCNLLLERRSNHSHRKTKDSLFLVTMVKSLNNKAVCDHLLPCKHLPSFDNFSILAHENKKSLMATKEILLMMKDKPSLNRLMACQPLD